MKKPLALLVASAVAAAGAGGYLVATHEWRSPDVPEVRHAKSVEPGAVLHKGRGVVTGVSAPDGYLELKHEPIPSMKWDVMQMGFAVADKKLLEGLKKGDIVEFEMRGLPSKDGDFVVERLIRQEGAAAQAQHSGHAAKEGAPRLRFRFLAPSSFLSIWRN